MSYDKGKLKKKNYNESFFQSVLCFFVFYICPLWINCMPCIVISQAWSMWFNKWSIKGLLGKAMKLLVKELNVWLDIANLHLTSKKINKLRHEKWDSVKLVIKVKFIGAKYN